MAEEKLENLENLEDKLYYKILDLIITLRDVQSEFKTYSASDIKKLIAYKKKEPIELKHLYNLELMIADIRTSLVLVKQTKSTNPT